MHSPTRKITPELTTQILELRNDQRLGARRIASEMLFLHHVKVSPTAIQRLLRRTECKPLKRPKRHVRRHYNASIPGARMQMDTMKVGPHLSQYTLIDDCTRFVYADIYPSRSAQSTLAFFAHLSDAVVYPIQRLQTDNGSEFTASEVVECMFDNFIRWRPISPGKPHLNGKVERIQRTIWDELYCRLDLRTANVAEELGVYLMHYNYRRVHGSLGMTPDERLCEVIGLTPAHYDIDITFNEAYERRLIKERTRKRMGKLLK